LGVAAVALPAACRSDSDERESAARRSAELEKDLERAAMEAQKTLRRLQEAKRKRPRIRIIRTNAFPHSADGGLRQLCECDRDGRCTCY
jgi:hypothetical protein